jgi:hypothetical protein
LRQQIATLEKRNADLEEGRDNFESQYALMEKQLASKGAELEAAEKEESDLEAILLKEATPVSMPRSSSSSSSSSSRNRPVTT